MGDPSQKDIRSNPQSHLQGRRQYRLAAWAFRERVPKRADVKYTPKNQTGGTASSRIVDHRSARLSGKGYEFESKIVAARLPNEYNPRPSKKASTA